MRTWVCVWFDVDGFESTPPYSRPTTKLTPRHPPNVTYTNTGTITTLSNWVLHRDKPLAALSCAGLALILGSNVQGVEWLPAALHESRLYNTLGCGMLIGSSYLAHRNEKGHDHAHAHGHSHDHHHHGAEDEAGKEGREGEAGDDRKAK